MRNMLDVGTALFVASIYVGCGDSGGAGTDSEDGSGTTHAASESAADTSSGGQDASESAADTSSGGEEPTGGESEPTTGTTMVEDPGDGSGIHCVTPGAPVVNGPVGPNLVETVTLAGTGSVGDVDVKLRLSGVKRTGYLRLTLSHGGTTIDLLNQKCEENKDIDVTLDDEGAALVCCDSIFCSGNPLVGEFQADQALAGFDGMPIAGDWTLEIHTPVWSPSQPNQGVLDELCLELALP